MVHADREPVVAGKQADPAVPDPYGRALDVGVRLDTELGERADDRLFDALRVDDGVVDSHDHGAEQPAPRTRVLERHQQIG
jgi:hypothetical protein